MELGAVSAAELHRHPRMGEAGRVTLTGVLGLHCRTAPPSSDGAVRQREIVMNQPGWFAPHRTLHPRGSIAE